MRRTLLVLLPVAVSVGVLPTVTTAVATPTTAPGQYSNVDAFDIPVGAQLHFDNATCTNSGSTVSVKGVAHLGGAAMELTFKNSPNGKWSKTADGVFSLRFGPDELDNHGNINIDKPTLDGQHGPGGNPYMYYAWLRSSTNQVQGSDLDPKGRQIFTPVPLGRCVSGWSPKDITSPDGLTVGSEVAYTVSSDVCSPQSTHVNVNAQRRFHKLDGEVIFSNQSYDRMLLDNGFHFATKDAALGLTLVPDLTGKPRGWGQGGIGGNPNIDLQWKAHRGYPTQNYVPGAYVKDQTSANTYDDNGAEVSGENATDTGQIDALGNEIFTYSYTYADTGGAGPHWGQKYFTNYTPTGRCKAILRTTA